MTVLVYGATARQGRAIAQALIEEGRSVRTVSRFPKQAGVTLPAEIETWRADLSDPASLDAAHEGVEAVVITLPLVFDEARFLSNGRAALAAAERAEVGRLIYNTSVAAADRPVGDPVLDAIHAVASEMSSSGLHATVLRPPLFLENLIAPWTRPAIEIEGVLRYPLPGDRPVRWINADTIGRAAAAALKSDAAGEILDISDIAPMTGAELAGRLAGVLDRNVRYEAITPDAFARRAEPWFGREGAKHLADLYRMIAATPQLFDRDYDGPRHLLGFEPRPSDQWLEREFGGA